MAREIWIDWTRGIDYVGGFRDAIAGRPAPTNLHRQVQELRTSFGLYMMLEDRGVEAARDSAISTWRQSHDLNVGAQNAPNLIYVGIVKSDQRDFIMRMREHEKKWLWQYTRKGHLRLKFGRVQYTVSDAELPQLIEDAESVIVFGMQPYENTAKISSYRIAEDIVVHNAGAHAPLKKTMRSTEHFI